MKKKKEGSLGVPELQISHLEIRWWAATALN